MKATGVVRRIDDLGRIVIPIDIRRSMNIRDGDPLEIFVDKGGEVILKKYSAIADLEDMVSDIAESLAEATGLVAMVTDRDVVVTVAGAPAREFVGKPVGSVVYQAMDERQILHFTGDRHRHPGPLVGADEDSPCPFFSEVIAPIVVGGDPAGTVIVASRQEGRDTGLLEYKLAEIAAGFIARHLEE
ncbi:MAG: AbrB/MazE/SpoVT family DNA-binding domain-containing protein [Symbiobacteriaceae bacterium]|nr:MAG: stage V sporulation protein T [Bacillota bacterium]